MIEPNRQGEVWVFAEQEDGSLHDVALELCGKARDLADRLGVKTGAGAAGGGRSALAKRLIAQGMDTVYRGRRSAAGPLSDLFLCAGRDADPEDRPADRALRGHAAG